MKPKTPTELLKHHVSGAIERGEATAIEAVVKSKHTPGPWFVADEGSSEDGPLVIAPDDFAFVQVYGNNNEARANARLIAAAPEMLEALEVAQAELEQHEPPDEYREMFASYNEIMKLIQSAIAKARGES